MKLRVSLFFALSQLLGPVHFVDAVHEKVTMSQDPAEKGESFIVVFKKSLTASADDLEVKRDAIVANYPNVSVTHTFWPSLPGFSAKMSVAQAEAMADSPDVDYIEQDGMVYASEIWGLDRIDQRNLPLNNLYNPSSGNGSGTYVYVLDTGIQITHNEFVGRADWGENTSGDGQDKDCHGHGTHVAGTVAGSSYGVAKEANVIAVKVLTCSGSGSTAGVIAGVNWVKNDAGNKKAVANMSLGGSYSSALNEAVAGLVDAGVPTVVAAGNDNGNACNYSPASEPKAITVGSTTSSDIRSWFSNYGSCVDIFAPGSSIKSAWIGDDDATATLQGTSMASPHVAGALAMFLADGKTAIDVEAYLTNTATIEVISDVQGSPNKLLYVGAVAPSEPPVVTPTPPPVVTPTSPPVVTPTSPPVVTPTSPPVVTPTPPPTKAPLPPCKDSVAFYTVGFKNRMCKDIPERKCQQYEYKVSCPIHCKAKQYCLNDSVLPFYNKRSKEFTCRQLSNMGNNKPALLEKKCKESPLFGTSCRATCAQFYSEPKM